MVVILHCKHSQTSNRNILSITFTPIPTGSRLQYCALDGDRTKRASRTLSIAR